MKLNARWMESIGVVMITKQIELTDGIISLRPMANAEPDEVYQAVRESLADLSLWMSWASEAYTIEDTRDWLALVAETWESGENYAFAIYDAQDGCLSGGGGLNHINPYYRLCNLGYWVRSSRAGRSFAPRATQLLARFAIEQLGLIRVEVVAAVGNERSLRAAEKAGARREGVLRNRILVGEKIYDAVMHSLIPTDFI
jgi:ribosomal-protein-serine acetyltransferase